MSSLNLVRSKHPAAQPNAGFIRQLVELERKLGLRSEDETGDNMLLWGAGEGCSPRSVGGGGRGTREKRSWDSDTLFKDQIFSV